MTERGGGRKLMRVSELSIVAHMSRPATQVREMQNFFSLALATFLRLPSPLSAHATLRSAVASVDEATLAAYLRVSIPTLRRYVCGELNMNWVICTRLAVLPNVQASKAELPSTTTQR